MSPGRTQDLKVKQFLCMRVKNKHFKLRVLSPPSHEHTHTHRHNSHLKKPQGFIFYKSSINGKVNVAVNKTKLLNCNLASSLWAYCIIFLHQQVTIKFEFVGSFLVSFTMQPGSLSFCFNANAMPPRGTS